MASAAWIEMSGPPPVFIIGCMRSGTTVLHRMMSAFCPRAIDIDDVDFECRTFWHERGFSIGSPKTGTRCVGVRTGEVTDEQRREITGYFEERARRDRHIVTKNPHLSNKVGLINDLFPDSRIVHIVREDMSVVASTKLLFQRLYRGVNYRRMPFRAYWPDVDHLPCWYAVPDESPARSLKQRVRRLLRATRGMPTPEHEDPADFRAEFPDDSRYYPGSGFARITESWLKINAEIVRQVDELGIGHRYYPVNYARLVESPRETLRSIASFCEIEAVDPEAVPQSLDTSRRERWRHDLSDEERTSVSEAMERFEAEARLLFDSLPGPLRSRR